MTMSVNQERAVTLGHPSYVWRAGQERRIGMLQEHVSLDGLRVLDVGCGLGLYVQRFQDLGAEAHGVDLDPERVARAQAISPHIRVGSAEALPYPEGSFDLVFANEVLEHVQDDRLAVRECYRVLRPGGYLAIFVPNRLYPFETHGFYWHGTYHFGNIPLINYLPDSLRNRLCPHVRAYKRRQLRSLFQGLAGRVVIHRCVYAGYDNVAAEHPRLGATIRGLSYALERTPLQWLGLSHLVIYQKADTATSAPREARD